MVCSRNYSTLFQYICYTLTASARTTISTVANNTTHHERILGSWKRHPGLLVALNCIRPLQDMKLYRRILVAWKEVTIALLQRAHNVQSVADALIYNRTGAGKLISKAIRAQFAIPGLFIPTLVQTLLYAHMDIHTLPHHLQTIIGTSQRIADSHVDMITVHYTPQSQSE